MRIALSAHRHQRSEVGGGLRRGLVAVWRANFAAATVCHADRPRGSGKERGRFREHRSHVGWRRRQPAHRPHRRLRGGRATRHDFQFQAVDRQSARRAVADRASPCGGACRYDGERRQHGGHFSVGPHVAGNIGCDRAPQRRRFRQAGHPRQRLDRTPPSHGCVPRRRLG